MEGGFDGEWLHVFSLTDYLMLLDKELTNLEKYL